jgi:hypothetical protein
VRCFKEIIKMSWDKFQLKKKKEKRKGKKKIRSWRHIDAPMITPSVLTEKSWWDKSNNIKSSMMTIVVPKHYSKGNDWLTCLRVTCMAHSGHNWWPFLILLDSSHVNLFLWYQRCSHWNFSVPLRSHSFILFFSLFHLYSFECMTTCFNHLF